jgi:hypothetical protein
MNFLIESIHNFYSNNSYEGEEMKEWMDMECSTCTDDISLVPEPGEILLGRRRRKWEGIIKMILHVYRNEVFDFGYLCQDKNQWRNFIIIKIQVHHDLLWDNLPFSKYSIPWSYFIVCLLDIRTTHLFESPIVILWHPCAKSLLTDWLTRGLRRRICV